MKTSELTGAALDWAVAKAIGEYKPVPVPNYSTDWAQGGPIIEREKIEICPISNQEWRGQLFGQDDLHRQYGFSPLVAAMRCYVASKLGYTVDLPKELT